MVHCCVKGCKSNSKRSSALKKSFFQIPSVSRQFGDEYLRLSTLRRERWMRAIGRTELNADARDVKVCSDHFYTGTYALWSYKIYYSLIHRDYISSALSIGLGTV